MRHYNWFDNNGAMRSSISLSYFKRALLSMMLIFGAKNIYAVPVSPLVNDISGKFSIELQQKYSFFADSSVSNLGYYVAKQGVIANQLGVDSVSLRVSSEISGGSNFPLAHLKVFGVFDSLGAKTDLSQLMWAAKSIGFTLMPAPITDVETFFIADGFVSDANGRIQPSCTFESVTLPNAVNIQIPNCSALDQSGAVRPLQSIYLLDSLPIDKSGNTQQYLVFDARAFNHVRPLLSDVLGTGASWDSFFSGQLRWQINNGKRVEIATLTINWIELYAELVKYMTDLNYVATQQDAYSLALRMIKDVRFVNAIKIKLAPGYSYGNWWNPNIPLLENIANEVYRVAKSKALITVEAKDLATGAIKRLNAINIDYKKVIENPIQTFVLYQRNNTDDIYAYTDLSVQCVIGAIDSEVKWNVSDQRCNYLR